MSNEALQPTGLPWDSEIEEAARNAMATGDLAGLERYLFDTQYFSPSWVFYKAVTAVCLHAKTEHKGWLEHIAGRAFKELKDCTPLVEMAIKEVEKLFGRFGDEDGRKRLEMMGLTLFAVRFAECGWQMRPDL